MRRNTVAALLAGTAALVVEGGAPANAGYIDPRCITLNNQSAERMKHFGLLLGPYKTDVLNALNVGGDVAAVKCHYIRQIEADQAVIYQISLQEMRICPGGQFRDPDQFARMLQGTRDAKAKFCRGR